MNTQASHDARKENFDIRLRHTFVAMLFALTAGQIALSAFDLFRVYLEGMIQNHEYLAPATHLTLAAVVLTASWVGWSIAAIKKKNMQLKYIFSWPYLILLLDIVSVISYFALVRSVEIEELLVSTDMQQSNLKTITRIGSPSAFEEILLVKIIFGIYLIWDIFHDVVIPGVSRQNVFKKLIVHASASGIALGATMWIGYVYAQLECTAELICVVVSDIALIFVVIGFRALKGAEPVVKRIVGLPVECDVADSKGFNWRIWGSICSAIYVLCMAFLLYK